MDRFRPARTFVKTSTAYADGGATLEDVRLMYEVVNGRLSVKAAGGVRSSPSCGSTSARAAGDFGRPDRRFSRAFQALPAESETQTLRTT